MEGNQRIVLHEPTPGQNVGGQVTPGVPIEHVVWAIRRDRGGGERLQADTEVGEWETSFQVRREGIARVNHTWSVTDDDDIEWDIEKIYRVPMPPRRWLVLYCVARS